MLGKFPKNLKCVKLRSMIILFRFHNKVYCLSSAEGLRQFTLNPKSYLLPPLPQIPCKICILGPPTSGKSTLANMLSQHYDAMVIVVL